MFLFLRLIFTYLVDCEPRFREHSVYFERFVARTLSPKYILTRIYLQFGATAS